MGRFYIMNPADVFIFVRQFPEPGASGNILTCFRVDPDIVNRLVLTQRNNIDPFQDIMPPLALPEENVILGYAGRKSNIGVRSLILNYRKSRVNTFPIP